MGIIARQSIKNSLTTYIGVVFSAVNTVYLVPRVFEKHPEEEWGLFQYIIGLVLILAPFSQMATPAIIIKYFPFFKNDNKTGFLFSLLIVAFAGLILISSVYYFFGAYIFSGGEYDNLFLENKYYVIPLLIFTVFFEVLSSYSRSLLKSTLPTLLKEFLLRFWLFLLLIAYNFDLIDFQGFLNLYVIIYVIRVLALVAYLIYEKELNFSFKRMKFTNPRRKELLNYGLFAVLSGSAGMLVNKIDVLMIKDFVGLKELAFYSIPFFIGSLIQIPGRSVLSIAVPIIARSWESNDIKTIKLIYSKTSINMIILGSFIFMGVWLNIDNVLFFLGDSFGSYKAKYVFLFIALSKLFDVSTGANGSIIITSNYYRADIFFQFGLIIVGVICNLIFIPIYGIIGAALATMISIIIYNAAKLIFVLLKIKIQPFSNKTLLSIGVSLFCFGLFYFIPHLKNHYVDAILRSIAFSLIYFVLVLRFKLSEDINKIFNKYYT